MKRSRKNLFALLLSFALLVSLLPSNAFAAAQSTGADHVLINQVYGASDDGYASHSFIELYNPTDAAVDLKNWSIQYRSSADGDHSVHWETLALTGVIGSQDYYLIRCGAVVKGAAGAYAVPEGNQEWNMVLHNKGLAVALVDHADALADSVSGDVTALKNTGIIDLAAVQGNDGLAEQAPPAFEGAYGSFQSKKKALRRVAFADTDNNKNDFVEVNYSKTVSADLGPHVGKTTVVPDPPYTPLPPAIQPVGFENSSASLALAEIGRYDTGITSADGGVMEIVDYNTANGFAYAVNGHSGTLVAIPLQELAADQTSVTMLSGVAISVSELVKAEDDTFSYGDMTSVAVSPDGKSLAVAIQAAAYDAPGRAAIFHCAGDGSLTLSALVKTGVQPDMITYTPDGSRLLTADEGEPRNGYDNGSTDPMGTVTIIDTAKGTAQTVDFTAYDSADARQALVEKGIVLKKDTLPSVDLEPEYIAVDNETAYVTLQEANAIGILDLNRGVFTDICSAGFEDYSKVAIDIDKSDEAYAPKTYENLRGIRMPDGISLKEINGKTYLLIANEGDARDYTGHGNEIKAKTSPTGKITLGSKVTWFDASGYDGLAADTDYLFGGRSFTLFRVDEKGLTEVFDSTSDFEALTANYMPKYFNCSNDDLGLEDRSGKKGPEPETVVTGVVGDRTYAFVTLERIGGVMVYDITDPEEITYVNYINSRDFSTTLGADDSPEGLKFVPAASGPTGKAMLLAACEVGGTVAAYELTPKAAPVVKNPFTDITADDYYYDAVLWAAAKDITKGTTETTFSPLAPCTRGQFITLLWRAAGSPTAEAKAVFEDVAAEDYFYAAVNWAAKEGIAKGVSEKQFSPDAPCTRSQIVTFLWRYHGSEVVSAENPFTDVSSGQYYSEAVLWAVKHQITKGTEEHTFSPDATCTRGQVVTFLYRDFQGE